MSKQQLNGKHTTIATRKKCQIDFKVLFTVDFPSRQ